MWTTIERKPSFGHRVTHPSTESINGEWFAPFSGQDADMLPSKSRKSSAKGERLLDNDRNACFAPRVFKIVRVGLHPRRQVSVYASGAHIEHQLISRTLLGAECPPLFKRFHFCVGPSPDLF